MNGQELFAQRVAQQQVVVIDGGLATQLETQGCNILHKIMCRLLRRIGSVTSLRARPEDAVPVVQRCSMPQSD